MLFATLAAPFLAPAALAATAPAKGFDAATVRQLARAAATKPFVAPDRGLPSQFSNLNYDQYRQIRFLPEKSMWRGDGLPFQLQLFHRGFLYLDRVDVFIVADGQATPLTYDSGYFDLGKVAPPPAGTDIGYAGFRVHAGLNRADYFDEICVFLGASYFRAVGKGQVYGQSARGLSIKTGNPGGEEFPLFRSFWIEKPNKGASAVVVHALLDSQSAAAAFRFTIRPGEDTVFDTELTLFPRVDLTEAGIGTLTSMFLFDGSDRSGYDDYRRAVHDSHGLLMLNGKGERLWRPLANPKTLQVSAFGDDEPRGFGLMQRARNFFDYEDLEAQYELRPSVWVEPIGTVGSGAVTLVEIPAHREVDDNIVAFWRPKTALKAGSETDFTYRLHWCGQPPIPQTLATVSETRAGLSWDQKARLFVLDFIGDNLKHLPPDAALSLEVGTSKGSVRDQQVQTNPHTQGVRASFQLVPDGNLAELRAVLRNGPDALSETWIYRWTG